MDLKEYKEELLKREGLPITEDVILYNDFELYNMVSGKSINFKSFEEAIEYEINGKKIKDIIESKAEIWQDDIKILDKSKRDIK